MIVREELEKDHQAVRDVTLAAFDHAAEADLVDALRESGELVLSLVAEMESEIVGHIAFSGLQAPAECLALAPVSVLPEHQNHGIGKALIMEGLARAKRNGWQGVFVLGEPEYYQRFGFTTATAKNFATPYPKKYFMALELIPEALSTRSGEVIYAQPFLGLE